MVIATLGIRVFSKVIYGTSLPWMLFHEVTKSLVCITASCAAGVFHIAC